MELENEIPKLGDYVKHIDSLTQQAKQLDKMYEDPIEESSLRAFLVGEIQEALDSYKGDFTELRHCCACGLPMKRGSGAWQEGYHYDSCI